MIFAVATAVLLPNEPEWLQAFRAKHMAHEPHITLVQPRIITNSQHEEIRELLADYIATKTFPDHRISVRFGSILENDTSAGPNAKTDLCLMLALDRDEQLMTIQKELVELLKGYSEYEKPHKQVFEQNFRPHFTLTKAELDEAAYAAVLRELPADYAVAGVVEEVQLLSKEDPDQLQPHVVAYHL